MQNSSMALNWSLSKLHLPVSQSTNWSMFRLTTVSSILDLVSNSPKIEQPSGILASASRRSARVQLRLSPTIFVGPATVRMVKLPKIS